MNVLVTGADGFIGRNLVLHLSEIKSINIFTFTRNNKLEDLFDIVKSIDFIFHLAGINRPKNPTEFTHGNEDLTKSLCDAIKYSGKKIPLLYTSSIQAELDNPYGRSKKAAENTILSFRSEHFSPIFIFRLPNVFGKWARPNYNSVVATFCYNISQDLPVEINDPSALINLVYIDDIIEKFLAILNSSFDENKSGFFDVHPQYSITVAELSRKIQSFSSSRDSLIIENVGNGFVRALYSTYISYLKPEQFKYSLTKHGDSRGVFVEILKTQNSGQFSYFTAHPGVTRGGHYHHSKTEKFLVVKGTARFRFRHMLSDEVYELSINAENPEIVETITGWAHDITNIGNEEMIVILWANEIFDKTKPDTYTKMIATKLTK